MAQSSNLASNADQVSSQRVDRLIDLTLGPAKSQCIYLVAKLGLAELLQDGPRECHYLSELTRIQAEPLYRLLRAASSLDVVTECKAGVFVLGDLGQLLLRSAPDSLFAHVILMNEEPYFAWGNAMHSLQSGRSAFERVWGKEYFEYYKDYPDKEAHLHLAMNDTQRTVNKAVVASYDFGWARTVCDVGGGHGALLSAVLQRYGYLSGVFFDLPSGVDAARAGVGGPLPRCEFVVGDFFTEMPHGVDVYLMKLVLHDWDDERAEKILQVCSRAMGQKSRLLLIESVMPDGPESSVTKLWDFHMLVNTGGRERTYAQFQRLAESSELCVINVRRISSIFSLIELKGADNEYA